MSHDELGMFGEMIVWGRGGLFRLEPDPSIIKHPPRIFEKTHFPDNSIPPRYIYPIKVYFPYSWN